MKPGSHSVMCNYTSKYTNKLSVFQIYIVTQSTHNQDGWTFPGICRSKFSRRKKCEEIKIHYEHIT